MEILDASTPLQRVYNALNEALKEFELVNSLNLSPAQLHRLKSDYRDLKGIRDFIEQELVVFKNKTITK